MDAEMAFNMAVGMAERAEVAYRISPDGDEMQTLIGSTAVYVGTDGGDRPCITFRSFFVHGVPLPEGDELAIYKWINERNKASRFGRFVLVENSDPESSSNSADLVLEFEILAEKVQQEEFVHSLTMMWEMADRFDDEAVITFGGRTHEDFLAAMSRADDATAAQQASEEEIDA